MPESKPNMKLDRVRFQEFQYVNTRHDAVVEVGTTPDDIIDPSFWSAVAYKVKVHDEIRVRCEDGSWIAYLLVTGCGKNYVEVVVEGSINLEKIDPEKQAVVDAAGFELLYRGIHLKWCVKRLSDGAVIHEKEPNKAAAAAWLTEHMKATRRAA